jgi:hypothetical protein
MFMQGVKIEHAGNTIPASRLSAPQPIPHLPAPLQANTFTDVLASVAAQWSPPNEEILGNNWGAQPQPVSRAEGTGSAHGGNYFMVRTRRQAACCAALAHIHSTQCLASVS